MCAQKTKIGAHAPSRAVATSGACSESMMRVTREAVECPHRLLSSTEPGYSLVRTDSDRWTAQSVSFSARRRGRSPRPGSIAFEQGMTNGRSGRPRCERSTAADVGCRSRSARSDAAPARVVPTAPFRLPSRHFTVPIHASDRRHQGVEHASNFAKLCGIKLGCPVRCRLQSDSRDEVPARGMGSVHRHLDSAEFPRSMCAVTRACPSAGGLRCVL